MTSAVDMARLHLEDAERQRGVLRDKYLNAGFDFQNALGVSEKERCLCCSSSAK